MSRQLARIVISGLVAGVIAMPVGNALASHTFMVKLSPTEFNESAGKVGIRFTSACQNEIELRYETKDGYAQAGRDFSAIKGNVRLSYSSPQQIELPVLQDSEIEGYETLQLIVLGVPGSGGGFGEGNDICLGGGPDSSRSDTFTLTIVDDDIPGAGKDATAGTGKSGSASISARGQEPASPSRGSVGIDAPTAAKSITETPGPAIEAQIRAEDTKPDRASPNRAGAGKTKGAGLTIMILGVLTLLGLGAISAARASS